MYQHRVRQERMQARKYKRLGLPVQRRTAVEYALYWRKLSR